jgi:putative thioredoxin
MSDPRTTPSIFTRGAVDLGALRQSQPPAGTPSGGPARPPAPATRAAGGGVAVIDVTEATFNAEVVERSLTTPVVIDFWADWCEPCKQLSPVLEKLAVEGNGSWVLAKIDVDANPRLSATLQVQSIPMVYAIVGGRPVDAFTGVMPESQLRQWLDGVLRTAGIEVEAPEDPRLNAADEAMITGDLDAAEQAYKKILAESPADAAAEAGLAQVGLLRRVSNVDAAKALAAAQANPDDVMAQLLAADLEVVGGRADQAYRRLIDLVRRVYGEDRDNVRRHLVSLFTVAGPDDPAVAAARRSLASALF